MIRLIGFLLILFTITELSFAQKEPVKFGNVALEDLQMTMYPGDTTAPAVILCDYGYFNPNTFQFTRILRIKILNKEGYNLVNQSFPTNDKSTIRGITSNLENGKIIQEKLKNESIFTERVTEGHFRTRISMPGVKVGSVVDVMFTYSGLPSVWKFQDIIPERYNELVMEQSKYIRFKTNFLGFEPLFSHSPSRWVAKNMPSFKEEPYMNSAENYESKLEIDILDIMAGPYYQAFATSWDAVSKQLMSSENFGKTLPGSAYLNSLANKIEEAGKSKLDNLTMAYNAIKKEVKWDERESLITSSPALSYIYKMKLGNSADINLMLVQLLKKLNIEATQIVLSTRENGILSPISPSIQKLNYVIASAKIDGQTYLLDATEPFMPYYLLPFRCLNYQGQTVNSDQSKLVELKTTKKDKKSVVYDLKLNGDNILAGEMTIKSSEYAAYDFRKGYNKFNSMEEFIEDFRKDKPGLLIRKAEFDKLDSIYLPVNEKYDIALNNKLSVIGNEVYLLPMFFDQVMENPFRMDVRKYPVDFGYNIEKSVISIITIPDNYSLVALPSSVNLVLPGDGASFLFEVSNIGSIIKMVSKFSINKSLFLQDEYPDLREFYNQMIKKQNEPVILKKI